jgi:hypothetical protein
MWKEWGGTNSRECGAKYKLDTLIMFGEESKL